MFGLLGRAQNLGAVRRGGLRTLWRSCWRHNLRAYLSCYGRRDYLPGHER
jgi:hypothetical protein